ncbi:MAG: hypothetical protein F6K55_15840 [Moorea sp. SIO4A3]|nr:hypothetical protein [Moorena sp. SIO4A3]
MKVEGLKLPVACCLLPVASMPIASMPVACCLLLACLLLACLLPFPANP